jgi:hypothetical protein
MVRGGRRTPRLHRAVTDSSQDEVVRVVAHRLVTELAPEELPLFRPISDAYFRDPSRTLDQRQDHDEVLGFGVDAAVPLMTPVVLAVVHDIVLRLRAQLAEQAAREGGDVVGGWLHRLLHSRDSSAAQAAPLSPAQLAEVRHLAHDRALALKLSETRATMLADSLTAQLATQAAT